MKTLFIVVVSIVFVASSENRNERFLSSTACSDVLSNCHSYDQSVCTSDTYSQWATKNCAKTCNKCPSGTGTGSNGGGNGGTMTGSSSGCVYKLKIYQQGQTWKDGCKLSCHCLDNFSGQYTCNELCLKWDLPSQCSMQPPTRGKCCPIPYCPAGFTINYPPGYVQQ